MNQRPLTAQPFSCCHNVVRIADPWHPDAFVGTPAEGRIPDPGGPRKQVWAMEDAWSNVVGTIDEAPPDPDAVIVFDEASKLWCWQW